MIRTLLYTTMASLLVACASISMPTGGAKDEQPPEIYRSTPDSAQLNFFSRKITLEFDENIKLNNLKKELIISPPWGEYDVKTSEEKIELTFDEYPETNTTYIFNFGNAIQDVNEGNTLSDYFLVFSTGNEIDTGTLSGHVVNHYSGESSENAIVLLYKESRDSNVFQGEPYYITKTNKSGEFKFVHLADGKYDLIVLSDENGNRKLDEDEYFGFLNEKTAINTDSIKIKVSQYQADTKLKARIIPSSLDHEYVLSFNKIIDPQKIKKLTSSPTMNFNIYKGSLPYRINSSNDSIFVFCNPGIDSDTIQFKLEYDSDTLNLKTAQNTGNTRKPLIPIKSKIDVNPMDSVELTFNKPIKNIRTSNVHLLNSTDSTKITDFNIIQRNSYKTIIQYNWKSNTTYELLFDSLSIQTFNTSDANRESIKILIQTRNSENLSSFSFTPKLDSALLKERVYAVLYTKNNEHPPIRVQSGEEIQYKNINPGTYKIKFFIDSNGDEKWNSSMPFPREQGETVLFYPSSFTLKANWIAEDNEIFIHK